MLILRLYIAVLVLVFLVVSLFNQGIGLLEGTVLTCGLLFLIFDAKKDLEDLRQIEAEVASLTEGG
jgi:hypothetical protein